MLQTSLYYDPVRQYRRDTALEAIATNNAIIHKIYSAGEECPDYRLTKSQSSGRMEDENPLWGYAEIEKFFY